ncbi:MAG: Yip1 family protein [Eubacteriales bacterium]
MSVDDLNVEVEESKESEATEELEVAPEKTEESEVEPEKESGDIRQRKRRPMDGKRKKKVRRVRPDGVTEEILVIDGKPVKKRVVKPEELERESEAKENEVSELSEEVTVDELSSEATNEKKAKKERVKKEKVKKEKKEKVKKENVDNLEENELLEFAVACKDMFTKAIVNPIEAVKYGEEHGVFETRFFFGGLYLFLVFITTVIHIPIVQSFLSLLDRFKIAGSATLLAACIIGLASLLIYAVARQDNIEVTYKNIVGAMCVISIPGLVLHLLIFMFGFFSFTFGVLVFIISAIYWMLLVAQVGAHVLGGKTRKANLIVLFIVIVAYVIVYFAIKLSVLHLLSSAITVGANAVTSSDGTVTGSAASIVEQLIEFLYNFDILLGNTN